MQPVTAISALPLPELDPWVLLALDPRRTPDPDHDISGFCRLPTVTLEDAEGGRHLLSGVLLLGLHSLDDAAPRTDDVELEFVVRDGDDSYAAVMLLSRFLGQRLAGLVGDAEVVVLALCNPQAATVVRPPGIGERPLWYADGDVKAWMQRRPGARGWTPDEVEIILAAERWHQR